MILTENELTNITGGGWGVFAAIGAVAVFIAGLVDGLLRPLKCR